MKDLYKDEDKLKKEKIDFIKLTQKHFKTKWIYSFAVIIFLIGIFTGSFILIIPAVLLPFLSKTFNK
jgi:uncharacterized protein YqhQ